VIELPQKTDNEPTTGESSAIVSSRTSSVRVQRTQPFVWTKTVDDIITKVKRGRATLDRITESATHNYVLSLLSL
jgi:hypothetical protein